MERSPLLDTFKRGEVNRELRLLAAEAAVAPRAEEQLELLVMLCGDADPEIAATAERTLESIPPGELAAVLAGTVPADTKARFAAKGIHPAGTPPQITSPLTGVTYTLRNRQSRLEHVPLVANTDSDTRRVYWFADNAYVGTSPPGAPMPWLPAHGGRAATARCAAE
jgi:membrane carboxypeptidase/penicillin-binding protein PbpC